MREEVLPSTVLQCVEVRQHEMSFDERVVLHGDDETIPLRRSTHVNIEVLPQQLNLGITTDMSIAKDDREQPKGLCDIDSSWISLLGSFGEKDSISWEECGSK